MPLPHIGVQIAASAPFPDNRSQHFEAVSSACWQPRRISRSKRAASSPPSFQPGSFAECFQALRICAAIVALLAITPSGKLNPKARRRVTPQSARSKMPCCKTAPVCGHKVMAHVRHRIATARQSADAGHSRSQLRWKLESNCLNSRTRAHGCCSV